MIHEKEDFYFLHIRHTGGKALYKNILNPYFYTANVGSHIEKYGGTHSGWHNDIDDKTYIFCVIREPIQLICSLFNNTISDSLEKEFGSPEKIRESFVEIVKTKPFLHDFQSKNILSGGGFSYYQEIGFPIDKDLLEKRLTRINYLVSNDYVRNNMQKIANRIAKDFNLEKINIPSIKYTEFTNYKTMELYNSLTEDEKKDISQYLQNDYEIYNKLITGGN